MRIQSPTRGVEAGCPAATCSACIICRSAVCSAAILFLRREYWDVPTGNPACAATLLIRIAANSACAKCRSSRLHSSRLESLDISASAICSARSLLPSISCCHVPGFSLVLALDDLLMSETIGGRWAQLDLSDDSMVSMLFSSERRRPETRYWERPSASG